MATKPAPSLETLVVCNALLVLVLQAVALFAAAGTMSFWQAWAYLGIQAATSVWINASLLRGGRDLLRRRFDGEAKGEHERVHGIFQVSVRLLGLGMLVVAGLDHRHGVAVVPPAIALGSNLVYGASWLLIHRVFRENAFASSIVEVGEGQPVIRSGLYGVVRHPMYTCALLGSAATPLALGSWHAVLLVPFAVGAFVVRLLAEERFLAVELPGYREYMRDTPKRLVPGLW